MRNGNYSELILSPRYGTCNDVQIDDLPLRKIVWLVPHVIRHRESEEVIIWRCNWGNVCKSGCLYAMVKEEINEDKSDQYLLYKKDFSLNT